MLCLGPKKSLTSPRLELTAQGVAFRCSKLSVKTTRLSRRPGKEVVYCCNVTLLSVLLASPFLCINGGGVIADQSTVRALHCRKFCFTGVGPPSPYMSWQQIVAKAKTIFFLPFRCFRAHVLQGLEGGVRRALRWQLTHMVRTRE